jgi:hypothetical protein
MKRGWGIWQLEDEKISVTIKKNPPDLYEAPYLI